MFVRHEVADYATCKKAYDGFRATRKKMGVVTQGVYQSVDNPNDVTVTHDFHSLEQAKAFAASPELKSAMETSSSPSSYAAFVSHHTYFERCAATCLTCRTHRIMQLVMGYYKGLQ
jgi:hypothetical protein